MSSCPGKSRAPHRTIPGTALILVALLIPAGSVAQAHDPVADPKAVVVAGAARFTVLTPQLIRMEWEPSGKFEDHSSLVFINRRLPVPKFTQRREGDWLVLETGMLKLRYRQDSRKFAEGNLTIELTVGGQHKVWWPGLPDAANLLGTTRTLDGIKGATSLEPGLVSRDGWVLVDDSARPLFDKSEWPWVMNRPAGERQDWYFFGHGHDYKQALKDFTLVAGKIPMPPRFAFGTWWSRYWAYTDEEFKHLVAEFEEHNVPLDVLVIDMDWHPTFGVKWWENKLDQAGQRLGWTGYTWNKLYFPDPPGFLQWTESKGLKTPLNLHPASGVQPHEEQYPEMARAMGMDPATKKYVPFEIWNKKFAENYFKILHHPLEAQGVDFWWLDWQQQHITGVPGLNPTWWLNYTHFTDMERRGKRALLFHRWGGLGNHRYQVGFSGDTFTTWDSLAFQPYFTATAANVGYGYWSHDIGGHLRARLGGRPETGPQAEDYPELYTRWVQYGVFSPILRTHTTKDPHAERRIWAYPLEYYTPMRQAFLLRYALIPYIYTASRQSYDTGISLARPLYYDWPEADEAYEFKDQYLFGDDLLLAPVTDPVSPETGTATKRVWLPPGEWFEWFTGARLAGGRTIERRFALDEIAVYARAGAVVPMQPPMRHTGEKPVDPLILNIVPGESGATRVYDDEGNTPGYQRGALAWTPVRHSRQADGTLNIEIGPSEGSYPGMLTSRGYEMRLLGALPPESVTVNGTPVAFRRGDPVGRPASGSQSPGWRYDGEKAAVIITTPSFSTRTTVQIVVRQRALTEEQARLLDGLAGKLACVKRAYDVVNSTWPRGWSPDILIEAAQTGRRIELNPQSGPAELEKLGRNLPAIRAEIEQLEDKAKAALALAWLRDM